MIISRAPFRVSFCGGGSDIPSFYEKYGGCVISTSIRKYVYLSIHKAFNADTITVKYSQTESVTDPSKLQHKIFRQAFMDTGETAINQSRFGGKDFFLSVTASSSPSFAHITDDFDSNLFERSLK